MSSSTARQTIATGRAAVCKACTQVSTRRRWASSSSSSSSSSRQQPEHKSHQPLLPGGRLPAKDLRKLVELHHLTASFITPETLDASITKAFSGNSGVKTATDDDLRALASARVQAQLDSGEAVTYAELSTPDSQGPQRNPRLQKVTLLSGNRNPLDVLGFSNGRDSSVGAAARADLEHAERRSSVIRRSTATYGEQSLTSDGRVRASINTSGQKDVIRTDRERRLREAMLGVVETREELADNRNAGAEPGLEKVLEYVKENGGQ